MSNKLFLFLSAAFILLLAACASATPTPQLCTEIGCSSQLTINLSGNVPGEYTLQAIANSGEIINVFCQNGQYIDQGTPQPNNVLPSCAPSSVALSGFAPDEVTITVVWGANGAITGIYRPTYTVTQPNGPGCPPTCRTGAVSLTIP